MTKKVSNDIYDENIKIIQSLIRHDLLPEFDSRLYVIDYKNERTQGSGTYELEISDNQEGEDDRSVLIHWDEGKDAIHGFKRHRETFGLSIVNASNLNTYHFDMKTMVLTITSIEIPLSVITIHL